MLSQERGDNSSLETSSSYCLGWTGGRYRRRRRRGF